MGTPQPTPQLFNRRKFLGLIAAAAVFGAAYQYGSQRWTKGKYTLKNSRIMMGTTVNFTIIGPDQERCNEALEVTAAHMEKEAESISIYNPKSPLSLLNRNGFLENAPPTLLKVTRMALEMSRLTDGAFDPTVLPLLKLYRKEENRLPPEEEIEKALARVGYRNVLIEGNTIRYTVDETGMTLDGIGKGFIVDEGIRFINELGFENVCIEAGGDLMVTGANPSGTHWTIAIRNPRPNQDMQHHIIKLKDRAIATSGDYMQSYSADRQYHHIINPRTGFSPPALASCSILAPDVAMADGLATSAMVMGPDTSIALLDSLTDCEGFLIGKDLTTYTSKDFFS
ncbi:MAG: FAD:protein FMN transferase [Desulfopila sp.]|jgi:thiamine biosynthesis lipoprotein|nr:FAD:protein FMN transferase [Desulfopila sp.]